MGSPLAPELENLLYAERDDAAYRAESLENLLRKILNSALPFEKMGGGVVLLLTPEELAAAWSLVRKI